MKFLFDRNKIYFMIMIMIIEKVWKQNKPDILSLKRIECRKT